MSNRLTFSLASLVLIFALVFSAMPVMAADNGPVPTITAYSGPDDPNMAASATNAAHEQSRTDFRLKVTFNALVEGTVDVNSFTVVTAEAAGKATTPATTGIGTITPITRGTDNGKAYMVEVNFDTMDADYSEGYVSFTFDADVVTGNQAGHTSEGIENQKSSPFVLTTAAGTLPKHTDWTLTPMFVADTLKDDFITAAGATKGNFKDTAEFQVKFTLSGGMGDFPDVATDGPTQIQIKDKDGMSVSGIAGVYVRSGVMVTGTYTVTGDTTKPPVFIGVNPNWAAGSTLRIPAAAAPTPDSVNPTVDIALVGIDETAKTFEVKFTFAKADVTGMAGKVAGALPNELMPANIEITKQDLTDPTADPIPMVASSAYVQAADIIGPISGGTVWLATVNYRLDALPLYVGLKGIDVSETTIAGMDLGMDDPKTLRVPADDTSVEPGAPDAPMLTMATAGNMQVALTWTIATTGDAATSFAYRMDAGTAMAIPGSDGTTTMHTVTGLTNGTEYEFEVRGVNAAGDGAWSNSMSAMPMAASGPVTDTMNPTVKITVLSVDANGKHTLDAGGTVRFDLLFSEELAKAPSISRLQVSDFTITRNGVLMSVPETALSAAMPTTMSATTASSGYQERYTLTLDAGANPQEIEIELDGSNVADMNGRPVVQADTSSKFDTVPPDVTITLVDADSVTGTPYTFTGEPSDKLTFQFAFTEALSPAFTTTDIHRSVGGDNFTLLADSDPQPVSGMPNTYTVVVTVKDKNESTTVLIKRLEIADAAKNLLQNDRYATYSPATTAPVASVSANGNGPFYCGLNGNRVIVTITDSESLKTGETIAESEITVSQGWKIRTGTFSASPTGAGANSATATFRVVRKDVENAADRTWLGLTSVTVTVAADAVMDNTNRGNAAKAETYTAGPVIKVPAGQYVVVVRDNAWLTSHLNEVRTLYLGDYNVRADNVQVQTWDCMPDLGLIFDVTVDASPGIGGGGLMVLQSPDHTGAAIAKGTVGISEIMWSEDRGLPFGATSNLQHAREQWIELHNTNNFDVEVTLFELIREEAYRDLNGNHATVTGNYAGLIDVMANYDIGGRWTPKGSDGNSELGHDFISMQRAKNAHNYAHGDNNGRNAGKWSASTAIYLTKRAGLAGSSQVPLEDLNYHFMGTPGRSNTFSAPGPITRTDVKNSPIIFNEVANRRDQTLEWIELKNVSDKDVDLRNYEISIVTGVNSETRLFHFNYGDNHVIMKPGELLLLVDTDMRYNDDHPVAVGYNVRGGTDQGLAVGDDSPRYLVTDFAEGGLPDTGEFLLILRTSKGDEGYENKKGTRDRVSDVVGYHPNLKALSAPLYTNLWPFAYYGTARARNKIEVETVHYRRVVNDPDQGDNAKPEQIALNNAGYTGVGYKRHAQESAAHGGTPGYEDIRKNLVADISSTGRVTISEIMFDQGDGRYPQWIELYNSSPTQAVNLHAGDHGWRLIIENFDDDEIPVRRLTGTLNFRNSDVQTILPQQTVIVASTRARNSGSAYFDTSVVFPPTRVFSVWDDARAEFDMRRATDNILSTQGFYIELIDGKGNLSDSVGNLVDSPNRRVASTIAWPLSEVTGERTEDMERSSIIRRYREPEGDDSRDWVPYSDRDLMDLGIEAEGWVAAHETDFREVRQTWFGHPEDYGSPGITGGRVLPVRLSKFRPERLDDGTVVVRWITESELNNAGFNILRSDARDGAFTKLNTQLIKGHGTTSERNAYEFTDTSAKPNVVYYYQIQDVSFDGDVEALRITHLRGNVSAAGKLTTTWGELKALQ